MPIDNPLRLTSDFACYHPGQPVVFALAGSKQDDAKLRLEIFHGGKRIELRLSAKWTGEAKLTWTPPAGDGEGYLAIASVVDKKGDLLQSASCGVDVSSKWTMYPRYGYMSHFEAPLATEASRMIEKLKDFHINALQFYDWQWQHHRPLSPEATWPDIAKRENSAATVRAFIKAGHARGMACMAYNLGYGATDGYETNGVSPKWALYDDKAGQKPYAFDMPGGWATHKLSFFDPGNSDYQDLLCRREAEAQAAFGFDGWHMDQVGNPGEKFTAEGKSVVLKERFASMLRVAKARVPGTLIFNNVGGYAIDESLTSPTDAMYLEAWEWEGQKTYNDLREVVEKSRSTGKASILTAYMDYDKAKLYDGKPEPGHFNPPGILLTNATILASGGSHLELGDDLNMLCHEYFPNRNLVAAPDLLSTLKSYYDFTVAYQTFLRGPNVKPIQDAVSLDGLPSSADGKPRTVWTLSRTDGKHTMIHLVNLLSADSVEWRDRNGAQVAPVAQVKVRVKLPQGDFKHAWYASPDDPLCKPYELKIDDGSVVLPRLDYWTMLVLE